ncbi:MAG: hypothetical protein AB7L36_03345 [Sphingomonadaceae bacterium]
MKKIVLFSVVAAASLGLAACSQSDDAAVDATNEVMMDANATAAEAVADVDAAAENVADAAAAVGNAADAVTNAADNAM